MRFHVFGQLQQQVGVARFGGLFAQAQNIAVVKIKVPPSEGIGLLPGILL